ncbi:MAG: DEAD/DEAH box helicase [Prevotellaceae bacterium]|nr:DEAD/DEAH box helicase [Prevotellaceae bacterium]
MKFEELDLNDNILDALYDMRFDECTPVQENCIPPILDKRDVLGVAQTGTGKTAAYLLPILSRLADGSFPKDAVNCIIMSPTRELAQQIDQAMQGFSYYLPDVSSVAVYGGNDGNRYDQEMKSMRLGADVIIATPGRLISHISMGNIDLSKVSFFVLDEADRMLDMGFSEDIMKIASGLPESCQTIMFSATMPKDIESMAQKLLKKPVEIKLAVSKPAEKINQSAYICYETQKLKIIDDIFKAGDLKRVIIFSGSKMKVKQINQALQRLKINCGEMHSDLDQAQRDEIMYKFKSGQLDVLVATDIVSRGIDIDDITMVINYDVPHDAEDYVHRIGRTARADRDGVAITFVNEDDMYAFHQIEKFLEREITRNPLPEGCGEGPEYTTTKRPGKTNARNRRRNDRNQTAHRDSKQHEHGRRNNRNTRGNNGKGEAQSAANTEKRQDNRQQQRQQGQNNNRTNETTDSAQRNTRTPNNNHKNRRQNSRQGNTEGRGQEQERNNNTERRNNYNRRNNNRRPQRQGEDRQRRNSSSPKAAATTAPVTNHESGIAKLIKRPLRWLKALGKK